MSRDESYWIRIASRCRCQTSDDRLRALFTEIAWVISASLLSYAALLLVAGAYADLRGRESRAKVKATAVTEIEATGKRLFAALERAQPQGIRYTTCRLPDGVTYVNLIAIDDGVDNPLLALPEARAFQEGLKNWLAEPSTSEQLTVFGSYRFF